MIFINYCVRSVSAITIAQQSLKDTIRTCFILRLLSLVNTLQNNYLLDWSPYLILFLRMDTHRVTHYNFLFFLWLYIFRKYRDAVIYTRAILHSGVASSRLATASVEHGMMMMERGESRLSWPSRSTKMIDYC